MESAQILPLVQRLRLLHEENSRAGRSPGSSATSRASSAGVAISRRGRQPVLYSSSEPDPFVAKALRVLKQIAVARSDDTGASTDAPRGDAASRYGDIQSLLLQRDPVSQRRQRLIERVLEQLEAGQRVDRIESPSPLQQELRLVLTPTGSGGGRFLVVNETAEAVVVRFEPQPIRSPARMPTNDLDISFEPPSARLDVGEACTVAILVQLDPADLHSGLDLAVRILAGDRILGRLWVELYPLSPPAREG